MPQICPLRIGKLLDKKEKKERSKAKRIAQLVVALSQVHESKMILLNAELIMVLNHDHKASRNHALMDEKLVSRTEGVNGPDGPTSTEVPNQTERPSRGASGINTETFLHGPMATVKARQRQTRRRGMLTKHSQSPEPTCSRVSDL